MPAANGSGQDGNRDGQADSPKSEPAQKGGKAGGQGNRNRPRQDSGRTAAQNGARQPGGAAKTGQGPGTGQKTSPRRASTQKTGKRVPVGANVESSTRPARARDLSSPAAPVELMTPPAAPLESETRPGRGRALGIAAIPAAVVFVVVLVIGAAVGSVVIGVIAAVVAAAAVWAGIWFGAERLLVHRLGGSFVEDDDVPRAANLVDGLCATMGLPLPALFLVDDPFRGALAIGRNERTATLVLTTGLLRALDPVELEGVLAHELSHVKHGDMATGTMAAAVVLPVAPILSGSPELVRRLVGEGRELGADVRATSVTRYPPGLRDALVKMAAGPLPAPPSALAGSGTARVTRWLWTVVPELVSPASTVGVLDSSATRIAALDEA